MEMQWNMDMQSVRIRSLQKFQLVIRNSSYSSYVHMHDISKTSFIVPDNKIDNWLATVYLKFELIF